MIKSTSFAPLGRKMIRTNLYHTNVEFWCVLNIIQAFIGSCSLGHLEQLLTISARWSLFIHMKFVYGSA